MTMDPKKSSFGPGSVRFYKLPAHFLFRSNRWLQIDRTPPDDTISTIEAMHNHSLPSPHLDFRTHVPIYLQIAKQIEQHISERRLKAGAQLPTVRALAIELGVNFNTVARAYRILDLEGMISTQRGRGTYILEKVSPETERTLRRQTIRALARQYISEAQRMKFSPLQIRQEIGRQLKTSRETGKHGS